VPLVSLPDPRADLAHHLGRALALLEAPRLSPASVHDIRRELKRARTALRLLRPAVGEAAYARENRALRGAARRLAAARDARVAVETLERLIERAPAASRAPLLRMRSRLKRRHARLLHEASTPARRTSLARAIAGSRRRSARWKLPQPWHSVLMAGMKRIYRRGRKALHSAETRASDRTLHEWRKQVKHLEAALGVLAPLAPRRTARAAGKAGALGDALGDDRDLALLCRTAPRGALDAPLLDWVHRRRGGLQKKALERGRRLYMRKPHAFVTRLLG
jgi:CHAD domain-containing protein